MYKIAIGIPSYQRTAMLDKLMHSILACNLDPTLIKHVDIIIVDNDVEKTAEPITNKWIKNAATPFCIYYVNCPTKGLAHVRNEIFERALSLAPDFIVGMDDDQYVTPNWLNELTATIVNNKADFAIGPVIPQLEKNVSPAIAQWFSASRLEDQKSIDFLETANLIIRVPFIVEHQLRFDLRFNTIGAEDTYFGISALKKGAKIFWAAKAIVYETIPEKRATLQWLIKRRFRVANTFIYIMILEKRYARVIKKVLVNFLYLILGIFATVLIPFSFKYRYFGVLKIAESFGGFAGLLNIKFHEYSTGR